GIAVRIFLDILAGLHAAHELTGPDGASLNLIHRDVSPQNMLIGADGISRITDFGVARAESRLSTTRGGKLKGKLAYMAPEQIKGDTVDRRGDVYAAGVVLWELLTGRRLFPSGHAGALIAQILPGAQDAPSSIVPEVPAAIAAVCMRALCLDPADRFPTAADFGEALEHAAETCGTAVAAPRAVAALVKQLAIHEAPAPPRPSL